MARNLLLGINKAKLICLSSRLLLDLMILHHSTISLNKFLLSYFSKWTITHRVCSSIIAKAVWSCCYFTMGFFVNKLNSVSLMYSGLRKKWKPQANFLSYSLCVFFFFFLINLFYFWLHWVFVAARGLSLVAASGGYSSLWCTGFSLRWLLLLWSTGSRRLGFSSCGSWALDHRLSSCGAWA